MNLKLLHLLSFVFGLVLVACTHTTSQQAPSSKQKSTSKRTVAVAGPSPNLVTAKNKLDKKPPQKIIPEVLPPGDPQPEPPIPYPEPPGYFPDPMNPVPPVSFPKSIRDSIVFPFATASFGNTPDALNKYIDSKIASGMEWDYIKELGIEGKIFIRLVIDTKGKVREVTFLKFTDKELEILKSRLKNALLSMPNWTPAKNEVGESVVSEYTLPYRIQIE
ncbi:MAG: hypothetical protein RLZZ65_1951 [Bacteroidota bacterium]|jgi:hypothetical protein